MRQFFSKWKTPLVLFGLIFVSYGLMIPWLGYSFDDWHFIYYATRGVDGIGEIFHYDGHPQAMWSYILSFRLLGYNPIAWHLYSLFLRWIAVVLFWFCLENIWHNNRRQNFFVVALFSVYPLFTLEVFPICYFEVWVSFIFLFLSFLFTIRAIRSAEKRVFFILLSILFQVGFIFTSEYAWFVELMRPVFIWFALPNKTRVKEKVISSIKFWAIHFIIFSAVVIWRGFFYTSTRQYFQVSDIFFSTFTTSLLGWIKNFIPDILVVLITSWYRIFDAENFYFSRPFNIILAIIAIFIAIGIIFYLKKIHAQEKSEQNYSWAQQAFFLSLPSIIGGIIPFYVVGYFIHSTEFPFNARFAIGILPGASLIIASFLESILRNSRIKILFIALLLSLAVVWHIRYTNDYRKIWRYQSSIFEELSWRVPGIEEDTALFIYATSSPEIDENSPAKIAFVRDFSTSMFLNAIYQINPEKKGNQLSYWSFSSLNPLLELPQSVPLRTSHATTFFEGNTKDSLVFLYSPEEGQCLHLIQSGDERYKQYPDIIKEIAPHLSADRINADMGQHDMIRNQLLGKGEKEDWCYYYESADLARQYQNWEEIVELWKKSQNKKLRASHGIEYIPFIEGFAHSLEWEEAIAITKEAKKLSHAMDSILCPLWDEIDLATVSSTRKEQAINEAELLLGCTS